MEPNSQKKFTEVEKQSSRIQIYPTSNTGISPFWKEKYEREAKKYWDIFYKKHQDRFFKDRHYLDKEWGSYFDELNPKVILEVGCGAGNTIFPLMATYPDIFVHACDFSPRAVDLVKSHKDFTEDRVNAFVCDLTVDELSKDVPPSSVDIITMIFVLSAVAPEKMSQVLQNISKVLKPNGLVLLRDYALGDLAQERLTCKDQKISENFYVRGDGTRAFYFSEDFLTNLFKSNGFEVIEAGLCCKQVENRSQELVMNRRWIQAVFRYSDISTSCQLKCGDGVDLDEDIKQPTLTNCSSLTEPQDDFDLDISESIAVDMFGISPDIDEIIEIDLGECNFRIRGLSKEYQHTCKSTGLMLWESARLMSEVIARNPSIIAGRRVLELGCGCTGVASMIAARSAELVVATDGDAKALDLLDQNVALNLEQTFLSKLVTRRLEWGNAEDLEAVKKLSSNGFEVIMGTDVTYVAEAISPLFATARELISCREDDNVELRPALILCHVLRRVDEPSILSAAAQFGFRLVDRWPEGMSTDSSQNIISPWFSNHTYTENYQKTALNIWYFHI
ncbi:hypothetical protein AQUCO_02000416v1 [Aquilegia coerulea]|uniref:Methyltransferase type 12 domain-containing protein n=1 Tax=Aquilegia coerulea TaxID=218851 RepID=A0A2G5DHG0_AQUCA|nr:hypothetical protein AQUCO_02000416v1 [Aquilegia coerulea]